MLATRYADLARQDGTQTVRIGQRLTFGNSKWSIENAIGDEARTLTAAYGYGLRDDLTFSVKAIQRERANENNGPNHGVGVRMTTRQ